MAASLRGKTSGPVHVIGHSVGDAVAVLFASKYPELTRSLTSVEGNFTLRDAFWSGEIAKKEIAEIEEILRDYKADVAGWIARAGVAPNDWLLSVASQWLDNQPATTLRARARAVVAATGVPGYLETVRRILDTGTRFYLVAGERSRKGWDVPDWVVAAAASNTDIKGTGHLMMLEQPEEFASAVCRNLSPDYAPG